ncbi:MAG: Smr/MutS family protein [Pseudomonadota bacterium]
MTPEDREVWARYSKTTEALPKRPQIPSALAPKAAPPAQPRAEPFRIGEAAPSRSNTHSLAPSLTEQIGSAPLQMGAKAHRKMTSGKLKPEGKIDLHGMTLDVAHPALTRFVLRNHADGKRLLLVVTGKGKHKPGDGPIPNRLGVLKHQVPQWLRMPPMSQVVLQVSQAHRSHGGEGAYYVYLRRIR